MPVLSSVRRCARLCLLLLLVCLAGLRPLTAQETRPFISADGVVTFQAPATWSVTDQDAGIISLQDATFTAVLYTPAALAQAGLADQTDPARLALAFVAARQRTPGPLSIFVSGGQPAARQDYTGGEAPAGFVLAVARGDSAPLLLDVTTAGDGRIPQRALEILLTTLEYRPQASPPAPFASYAADGLRFDYPRQWQVAADADRLTLTGPDFTARLLAGPALDVYQVDDPARLVTAYLEAAGYAPGRFDIFLSGRRPAARFEYTAADGTSGLLLGFALADGPLLLLDVLPGPGVNAAILQKDLERVVASLDPAAATATVTTPAAPAATAPVSPARPVAFASSDGTLSLTHPDTWFFGQDDTGRLYGFLGDPAVSLTLYPPELLLAERYPMTIGETPAGFLERYRANFGLALGSIDTDTPPGDLPAARRPVTLEAGGEFVALQLPGGAFVIAESFMFSGDYTPAARAAVDAVLATLAYTGSVVAQEPTAAGLPALTQYAAGPERAIIELENLGLIPFGGRLLTQETYLFFRGAGELPVRLTSLTAAENLVMAGEITYQTPQAEPGDYCALSARRNVEAGGQGILRFGITSDGLVFYTDEPRTENAPVLTESARLEAARDAPQHFLLIAIDDRITLFVDGQPIFVQAQVEERSGVYALVARSSATGAACEGRDMWVYRLPEVVSSGVCEVRTVGVVNQRGGPGTDFAVVGELPGFTAARVIGQTTGADGFRWWQLDTEAWVRGDIVTLAGDCGPFITPAAAPAEATDSP